MRRTRRRFLTGLGAAAAATAFYASYLEPRWLRTSATKLHFPALPEPLEGLRIALLTDIHAGGITPRRLLPRLVSMTRHARPDLIAVTGDLAETPRALRRTLACLAELDAPLGVHLVPGNHDHATGIGRWHAAVAAHPSLIDLTNAARVVTVRARAGGSVARLCVAGVDDRSEGAPRLDMLPPPHARDFTVLLAHQPDQAEDARRASDSIDLVLSGHTHGGQVRLPLIGALINPSDRPALYESGLRRRPWTQVYTSRGIGTVRLPLRFLTRPEIAILTLTAAPRPTRSR